MEILNSIKIEAQKRPWAVAATAVMTLGIFIAQFAFKKFHVPQHGAVLITGCSSGIGHHMAKYIAEKLPFMVFATVRKDEDMEKLRSLGLKNLVPLKMDVCQQDTCDDALKQMTEQLEIAQLPLIAVIHNAAISMLSTVEFTDMDKAKLLFETNFFSPVRLTKLLLPTLRHSKARIIMISSMAGTNPMPLTSMYSAAKFALEGFSMALRKEVEPLGVSVSVIKPAFVRSQMSRKVAEGSRNTGDPNALEATKVYPFLYTAEMEKKWQHFASLADDPIVVTRAAVHALTSPYPCTRYHVANIGGIPAWFYEFTAWLKPDRFK